MKLDVVIFTIFAAFVETGNAQEQTIVIDKNPVHYGPRMYATYSTNGVGNHQLEELEIVNQYPHKKHIGGKESVHDLWKEGSQKFNSEIPTRNKRKSNTETTKNWLRVRRDSNDKNISVDESNERINQTYSIDVISSIDNQDNSSWPIYAVLIGYKGNDNSSTLKVNNTFERIANEASRKKRQSNAGMEFAYKENNLKEHQKKNASKSQTSTYQENLEEEYSKERSNHDYNGKIQNSSKVKGDENVGGPPGNEAKKNATDTPKGESVFPPTMFWCQCPQTKSENDGRQVDQKGDGPVIVSGSLQKMFSFGIGGTLGFQFRKPKVN